jgi:hypothetical protein
MLPTDFEKVLIVLVLSRMPTKAQSKGDKGESDEKDVVLLRLTREEAEEVLKLIGEIRKRR